MDDKALVVLSGGQDSTTCLFAALKDFPETHAVVFDYGQRHKREIESAIRIAAFAGVPLDIVPLGPTILSGRSPLTDPNEQLETYESAKQMEEVIGDRVELTFVPMRNALFLVLAANRAVCLNARHIFTGVCQADNANYPDCRLSFIEKQEATINEALGLEDVVAEQQMVLHAPLMVLTKAESIKMALTMDGCYTAIGLSHTAYSGEYPPVTQDHAMMLRADGFEKAGLPDPLIVRAWWEGLMDLPTGANYQRWVDEGLLVHVGMNPNDPLSQPYASAMKMLELRLRHAVFGAPAELTDPAVVEAVQEAAPLLTEIASAEPMVQPGGGAEEALAGAASAEQPSNDPEAKGTPDSP